MECLVNISILVSVSYVYLEKLEAPLECGYPVMSVHRKAPPPSVERKDTAGSCSGCHFPGPWVSAALGGRQPRLGAQESRARACSALTPWLSPSCLVHPFSLCRVGSWPPGAG